MKSFVFNESRFMSFINIRAIGLYFRIYCVPIKTFLIERKLFGISLKYTYFVIHKQLVQRQPAMERFIIKQQFEVDFFPG